MDQDDPASALACDGSQSQLDAILQITHQPSARLSEGALRALAGCLGSASKAVQRRAVEALAAVAPHDGRVVSALTGALESDNPRARFGAAYALGTIAGALDLRAQKPLLEALANPDGDVRWAAAELIVRLGQDHLDEVRRGLIDLEKHPAPNARKMAIYCLRDLGFADPEVRAMVARASRVADAGVRLAALSLLAHLGQADDAGAGIALRCLGSDPDPGVRRAAAIALGRLGKDSRRAREALERAADQSEDSNLRKAARHALAMLERSA